MITIDYNRGRGVLKSSKNDYVILEQPLILKSVAKFYKSPDLHVKFQFTLKHRFSAFA